ncbi:MAG TPA: HEAT repeat domain-containing protein [Gemmataceae bacterium]|nr:HEAT repeat domain-containing protein [Gemmataceae bacterium]
MRRPQGAAYIGFTLLAAAVGAFAGSYLPLAGRLALFLAVVLLFAGWIYFVVSVWNVPKNHPMTYVLGLPVLICIFGGVATWIDWTSSGDGFLQSQRTLIGEGLGLVAGLYWAPGFLRRLYRWSVRPGAPIINLIEALSDAEAPVRRRAAMALTVAPTGDAIEAVPALQLALEDADKEVRGYAGEALRNLDVVHDPNALPPAPPPQKRRPIVRAVVWTCVLGVLALALYGFSCTPAGRMAKVCLCRDFGGAWTVPTLLAATTDDDAEVRYAAESALHQLGPAAVPALTAALDDPNEKHRLEAAEALADVGPAAKAAVPALQKAAADWPMQAQTKDAPPPALVAAGALAKIDPAGVAPTLPLLRRCLGDADRDVRLRAVSALGDMGPAARPAVADLEKTRDDAEASLSWLTKPSAARDVMRSILHPDEDEVKASREIDERKQEWEDEVKAIDAALKAIEG